MGEPRWAYVILALTPGFMHAGATLPAELPVRMSRSAVHIRVMWKFYCSCLGPRHTGFPCLPGFTLTVHQLLPTSFPAFAAIYLFS